MHFTVHRRTATRTDHIKPKALAGDARKAKGIRNKFMRKAGADLSKLTALVAAN